MGDDVQTSGSGAVKSAASELVRAYRAIDKVDRWSGGGQTLAFVVKSFGWVGLLCVLWALVSKLNEVARSLDPVRNGIARLGTQLEESRASLAAQEEQRRGDALKLSAVTAELRDSLARLQHTVASVAAAQDEAARAAAGAARQARENEEKLRTQAADAAAAQAALLRTLDDAARSAAQAKDTLAKADDDAVRSATAATAAAQAASAGIEQMNRAVAAVDVARLKTSVARASLAADELSATLEKAAKEPARQLTPSAASGAALPRSKPRDSSPTQAR